MFCLNIELSHSAFVVGILTRTTAGLRGAVHHSPPEPMENSYVCDNQEASLCCQEQQDRRHTQTGCHASVVAKRQKNPGSVYRRISPQRIMLARYCSLYGPELSSWSRSSPCSCRRSRKMMSRLQQRCCGVGRCSHYLSILLFERSRQTKDAAQCRT